MDDGFRIKINSPKESEMTIHDATVSGFKNAAIAGVVASGPVVSNLYSLGDTPGSEFKPQCVLDNLKSILIVWDGSLGLSNPEEAL